jgi:Tat protein translocase TatB subunit
MFDIGFQELLIIFIVALLVFGPEKLPEISRTLGKWVIEIRRGINIAKSQMEEEMKEGFKMPDDIVQSLPKDEANLETDEDLETDEQKDEEGKV